VALALFVAGDALDKAVFPRETENKENKGWKWVAPATLAELKIETRKHLNIDSGYYEVSKSLAVAAGRYTGSWIQVKNELAKFVRSAVLPMAAVSVVRLFRGQWGWVVLAAMASLALLMLYGRLKASHMVTFMIWRFVCRVQTKLIKTTP